MSEKVNMFGSNHDVLGSSDSNLILRTKGKVKILYGRKFIDLIEDGKIVGENSKFIYHTDTIGTKDGIYVIGEGDDTKVILVVGDLQITLLGEIGTTYVSFMAPQETTSSQKEQALLNIGFLYPSLGDIDSSAISNGIVYVESEQKLYVINGGALTEYSIDIPNPYTLQFVILKSDSNTGSLVIKGSGVENSLAFDKLYIYVEDGESYISSDDELHILIDDDEQVTITSRDMVVNVPVKTKKIQSPSANEGSGYRLYVTGNESTLEIDDVYIRGVLNVEGKNDLCPTWWLTLLNVIRSASNAADEDSDDYIWSLSLKYPHNIEVDTLCYVYVNAYDYYTFDEDEEMVSTILCLPLLVTDVDDQDITVLVNTDNLTEEQLDMLDSIYLPQALGGAIIFVMSSTVTRLSEKGIDIVPSEDGQDSIEGIMLRIGQLDELNKTYEENGSSLAVEGQGLYSQKALFDEAMYVSGYQIASDDNSSRLATTEWVNQRINEMIKG